MPKKLRSPALRSAFAALALAVSGCGGCDAGLNSSAGIGSLEPATLAFQQVRVGSTRRLQTRLRNTGSGAFAIRRVDPENAGEFILSALPADLDSNAELVVSVLYSPIDTGVDEGRFVIYTDASDTPEIVLTVRGEGVETNLAVAPETLDFGIVEVLQTAELPLTILNAGLLGEDVYVELGEGSDAFEIDSFLAFPLRLEGGSELPIPIRYRPARAGEDTTTLLVRACETCAALVVPVRGRAVESFVEVRPSECVEFGAVTPGNVVRRPLSLRNLGLRALEVQSVSITSGGPVFGLEPATLPASLAHEQALELSLTYAPAALRADQGTVVLATDDPRRPTISVCLRGSGGGPELTASPRPLDFGLVAVGVPKVRIVNVGNVGNAPLAVSAARVVGSSEFTVPAAPFTVPAGGRVPLLVTYTPVDDGADAAQLVLDSDDSDHPAYEVPLAGLGRVLPPCDLEVLPADGLLDFGNIAKGRTSRLNARLRNRGATDCLISLRMEPGGAASLKLVDPPLNEVIFAAGETRLVPVEFKPTVDGAARATVTVEVSDPANPVRTIGVRGLSAAGCLFIAPEEVDFGTVGANCSTRDREIVVYSTCANASIRINSIVLSAGADQPFVIGSLPPLPATVSGSQSVRFRARYAPTENASHFGAILLNTSERPEPYNIGVKGRASADAVQRDRFSQERVPTVDMLFIIDNSGSMESSQTSLANNFGGFMQFAITQQVDYRIAVTTTDVDTDGEQGRFLPVGGQPRWITPQTPNKETLFQQRIMAGTDGSGDEQGLEGMYLALSPPASLTDNANFLRPDAFLSVIVVSDEEDSSPQPVAFYYNFLVGLKQGRRNLVGLSSVALNPSRYQTITAMTDGKFTDITTADWSASLRSFGAEAFGYKTRFYLSSVPTPGTMEVTIDGVPVAPVEGNVRNYTYRATENMIEFSPLAIPEPGQTLEVSYVVQCGVP
jgi:hypothetical protein